MSTSVDLAPRSLIADDDDLDADVVALTHWRRGDVDELGERERLPQPAQPRVARLRPAGVPRHADVDELDDEPDDLRLLAWLRRLDDLELPAA
jgi:hypothetical protein